MENKRFWGDFFSIRNRDLDLGKLKENKFYEWVIALVVLFSFALWLGTLLVQGGDSLQLSLFFNRCGDFLADTTNVVGYSAHRDPYHNTVYTSLAEKGYPPLTYVFYYFLSKLVDIEVYDNNNFFLSMYAEPQYMITIIILTVVQIVLMYEMVRTTKKGGNLIKVFTALAFIVSEPVLFSIERANTIIPTMVFVGIYLYFYNSANKIYKEIALLCLALAAGLKMTPAILGILLLYNKQWKEAVRAVIYGCVAFFVPFLFLEGGFSNIAQMINNVRLNLELYSIKDGCTLVACVVHFVPNCSDASVSVIKILTYLISAVLLLSVPFYKNKWEKIMAVSIVLVVLPSHSGYYCILYVLPAFIAFLNEENHDMADLFILLAALCIMNVFQNAVLTGLFDYETGIFLILFVLLYKGVSAMISALSKSDVVEKASLESNAD
jgi:hypothetical protein